MLLNVVLRSLYLHLILFDNEKKHYVGFEVFSSQNRKSDTVPIYHPFLPN